MDNNSNMLEKIKFLTQQMHPKCYKKEYQQPIISIFPYLIYNNSINQQNYSNQQNEIILTQNNQNQFFVNNSINSIINAYNNDFKHKSKKDTYGKGIENQRMKKLPHYGEPYDKLEIFIKLGKPGKKEIIEIGEKYNQYFNKEIKENIYPKFGRDQKRNKALAVWFFEDCKEFIIPWLKEKELIDKTL